MLYQSWWSLIFCGVTPMPCKENWFVLDLLMDSSLSKKWICTFVHFSFAMIHHKQSSGLFFETDRNGLQNCIRSNWLKRIHLIISIIYFYYHVLMISYKSEIVSSSKMVVQRNSSLVHQSSYGDEGKRESASEKIAHCEISHRHFLQHVKAKPPTWLHHHEADLW